MEPVGLTDEEFKTYKRLQLRQIEDDFNEHKRVKEKLLSSGKKDDPLVKNLVNVEQEVMDSLEKEHIRAKEILDGIVVKPGQPEPVKPVPASPPSVSAKPEKK